MSGVICDMYFFEPGTVIVPATGPGMANGEVFTSVLIGTTGGTPKFVIYPESAPNDVPYSTRTKTNGHFTGLVPGTYIVNARTSSACVRMLRVVIHYEYFYEPRWRVQHESIIDGSTIKTKIDIEDLQFTGDLDYVTCTDVPHSLNFINDEADNVFEPVIGSELVINLIAPTDGYFDELTTSYDEGRFRATYYISIDDGPYVMKWQGFVVAQNSDEEYWRGSNIPVSVMFSDGLKDLAKVPFKLQSGAAPEARMSIIKGIASCLYYTGLRLDIWGQVPIGQLTTDNNILSTVYFDPHAYLQEDGTMEDCLTVLRSLLLCFGARVSLSGGVWVVETPVLNTGIEASTLKFDYTGQSIPGTIESSRISLKASTESNPKVSFESMSSLRSHQTMYGKLKLTFDYGLEGVNNILANGDFIDDDAAAGQFRNWQAVQTGVRNGVATTIDPDEVELSSQFEEGEHIFQAVFDNSEIDNLEERYVTLTASDIVLQDADFKLRLSFDVRAMIASTLQVIPSTNQYAFFDYSVLLIDDDNNQYILSRNPFGEYSIDQKPVFDDRLIDGEWMREYIDDSNQWKTVLCDNIRMSSSIAYPATLTLRIRAARNKFYDFPTLLGPTSGLGDLRDVHTEGLSGTIARTIDNRKRCLVILGSNAYMRTYTLQGGEEADDGLNIIKPDDSTKQVWKLINNQYDQGNIKAWVRQFNLRKVAISYLPADGDEDGDLQTSETLETVFNASVKNTLELIVRHGDLSGDDNYKNIMRGWFSLADGTPTKLWEFRINSGASNLTHLQLLTKMYQGQYAVDRVKLTGSLLCMQAIPFLDKSVQEPKTGKVYVICSSAINTRIPNAQIAMIEALQGSPVPPDDDIEEEPPVDTREHTEEFTNEFA